MKWMLFLLSLLLTSAPALAVTPAGPAHGAAPAGPAPSPADAPPAHTETDPADHPPRNHHVALFVGGTTNFQHDSTDFTLGGEYEFRLPLLHRLLGIGVFGEAVFAHHDEVLCGVPVFLHPVAGLKFFAAPGAQIVGSDAEFLVRVGAGYDFHAGAFSITPAVYTDIVDGHATLAYGMAFGLLF